MSRSVPRLRSPGKAPATESAFANNCRAAKQQAEDQKKGKVMPVPQLKSMEIPAYTQEELDNDVVKPNFYLWLYERTVVVLSFCAMLIYMGWRWSAFVQHPSSYWISAPLILSETCLVIPGKLLIDRFPTCLLFSIHRSVDSPPPPQLSQTTGLFISYFMIWHRMLRPRKRLAAMNIADADKPTVDVLIPCYTEPLEVRFNWFESGPWVGSFHPTGRLITIHPSTGHPRHARGRGQHGLPQGQAHGVHLRRRQEPRGCVHIHMAFGHGWVGVWWLTSDWTGRPLWTNTPSSTHPHQFLPINPSNPNKQRCARWWTRFARSARPAGTTSRCATSAATRRCVFWCVFGFWTYGCGWVLLDRPFVWIYHTRTIATIHVLNH